MAREFTLPDTGEGIQEAEILEVLVEKGDEVEQGQNVLVIETDKASLELPAPESGVIEEIRVKAGETASVGDVLMTFTDGKDSEAEAEGEKAEAGGKDREREAGEEKEEDEEAAGKERPSDKKAAKKTGKKAGSKEKAADEISSEEDTEQKKRERTEAEEPSSDEDEKDEEVPEEEEAADTDEERAAGKEETDKGRGKVKSVPATRRLARELGVDMNGVTPTGENGRVTDDDVRRAADKAPGAGAEAEARQSPALPDFEQWGEVAREPLRSLRRATARRMATAWQEIPHVTHMDAVAIDVLEEFRRRHRDTGQDGSENLTLTAFIIKAAGVALRDHPRFNASLDTGTQEIVRKKYLNIGFAVATDRGLMVPVVRDVDRKSVLDIATEIAELSERARQGKASKEDLSGGCFTITNIGSLGGRAFTPVINWPEVAILGLGQARIEPVAEQAETGVVEFFPRLMLPLCLAFDHRVNDGADAARFMASVKEILDDPDQFLLAA